MPKKLQFCNEPGMVEGERCIFQKGHSDVYGHLCVPDKRRPRKPIVKK